MRPQSPPAPNREQPVENRQRCGASDPFVVVTENLDADYPITSAELAAIETYLGDILDTLFEGTPGNFVTAGRKRRKK